MKYANPSLRPGLTAIAAALVLSSTPSFAQDATATPDPAAPVVVNPPSAPAESIPAASSAPTSELNIPRIAINMDDAPKDVTKAPTPTTQHISQARTETARTADRAATPNPMPLPVPAASGPIERAETAPPPPPMATASPSPAAVMPLPTPASTQRANPDANDALPIAGGLLAALAMMGGAFAIFSRKRQNRSDRDAVVEEPLALTVPVVDRPAPADQPVLAPEMAKTDAAGLDLSPYGRHVQAAYRGPTLDNPSMSLRKRLKRARFYDQRERMAAGGSIVPQAAAPQPAPVEKPERTAEYVASRRFSGGNAGFRPAFQH